MLVARFLRGNRLPALPETFFEGIAPVPAATFFEVPLDGPLSADPVFRPYWDLAAEIRGARAPASYEEALDEFRHRLAEAVGSHHVADVPIGSLLSGGLDSAVLASLLAEVLRGEGRPCPTFSFGFREAAPDFCELRYVDAAVRRAGFANFETTFDARWVGENAGRVIRALEEPPLALPALAQFRVFELARQHGAVVVMDGEGADEILGGYPYYQRLLLMDRLRHGRLADFSRELSALARRESRSRASVLDFFFAGPLKRRFLRKAQRPWLSAAWGAGNGAGPVGPASPDPGLVNRRLYFDVRAGNVPIVLNTTDRNSMAHSVEARVPFFDRKLVAFAFSLPDAFKVGDGQRKRILRDVARATVPPEITERTDRMGFATPDEAILREGWPVFRRRVLADGFPESAAFVAGAVRGLLEDFEAGRDADVRRIWRLFALATWQAEFGVVL